VRKGIKEVYDNVVKLKADNEELRIMNAKHIDTLIEKIKLEEEVAQLRMQASQCPRSEHNN